MLHPVSFKTIITINVTNSTQKLQIDYKNASGKLQRNYCEITKICKVKAIVSYSIFNINLRNISNITSKQTQCNKDSAREQLLFMFGRCPVLVRQMFGIRPNKQRAYSEQIADKDWRSIEARLWLRYGKSGCRYEKCWRGI